MSILLVGVLAFFAAWAGFGWASRASASLGSLLAKGSVAFELPWWANVLGVAAFIGLPWTVLTFPLSFYSGFLLRRAPIIW